MADRIEKPAEEWTDEQLIGWATGDNRAAGKATDKSVAEEIYKRMNIEGDPDVRKARDAVKESLEAENEEDAMAEAPVEESVETAEQVEEEPKKDEPVKEEPKPEPVKEEPKKETVKPVETGSLGTVDMIFKENMDNYISQMMPGVSHTGNSGPSIQVKFYRTIKTVLRQKGNDFNRMYGELLRIISEHRNTVFAERYAFRYFDMMNLSNAERRNFERMLNLMLTTCDPKTRSKTIEQVDLDASVEGFRDPEMHQRLIAFYTKM